MKILFRADDLGISKAVNLGIRETILNGPIKNVGLMTNMSTSTHGYEVVKDLTGVCLGLHTNICLGLPLTESHLIPSLIDDETNEFCSSVTIRKRAQDVIDYHEVKTEIIAQVEKFIEIVGKKPDYIDGHAVASITFFQALQDVAKEYDVFYVDPMSIEWASNHQIHVAHFWEMNEDNIYDVEAYLIGDDAKIAGKDNALVIFHPGYLDAFILEHSSFTTIRALEVEVLCSKIISNWLVEQSLDSVTFLDIIK